MDNSKIRITLLTGVLACFSFVFSNAQPSVKSTIGRNEILIGEQFKLTVTANYSEGDRVAWLAIPDSIRHFEVIDRSKIDSLYTDHQLSGVTQTITFTSFDSGQWTLPPFRIGINPVKGDTTYNFFTDAFPVTVSFSVSDTTSQLKDIKPIRQVEVSNYLWYWLVGGVLLLIILGILLWYFLRNKKKVEQPVVTKSSLSAYDEAIMELKKLEAYNFADATDVKRVHTRIGEILKNYLSRRENDNYLNKTTGDVLILLKDIGVNSDLLAKIAAAMRSGDAVKFAKYLPDPEETTECISSVKQLIESFKQNNASKPV